jgi:hypothetical protein
VKNGKQDLQEVLQIKFGNLNIFIKKNIMVQPKYSPEEALKVIKLRMNYDSSKTLNENVVVLKEQDMEKDAKTIERELGVVFTDEQNIVDILLKYDTPEKFKQMLAKYKEVTGEDMGADFGSVFNNTSDSSEYKQLQIHAKNVGYDLKVHPKGIGNGSIFTPISGAVVDPTKEVPATKGFDSLKRAKEIKDIVCTSVEGTVKGRYVITIGPAKDNDLYNWARRYGVTNQEIEDARKKCGKKDSDGGGTTKNSGGSTSKPKYTPCEVGKYVRGCKSEVVKKVQACLEMPAKYHTGNFGPITQGELQKKFPDLAKGFTDKDVDVICKKTIKTVTTPGEEGVYDQDNA